MNSKIVWISNHSLVTGDSILIMDVLLGQTNALWECSGMTKIIAKEATSKLRGEKEGF